jgi:hypothetical protein
LNFHSQYVTKGITYDSTAILMDQNPIRTALSVCNYLINQSVSIIPYLIDIITYSHNILLPFSL